MSYPKLVFIDDVEDESMRLFGVDCTLKFTDVAHLSMSILALRNPDQFIELLSKGELLPDAVLLDVDFEALTDTDTLELVDPRDGNEKGWPKREWGHAVLRTIKRIDPDLPVLMLTGLTATTVAFKAGRFGADEFCDKATLQYALDQADEELNPHADDFMARVTRAIDVCRDRALYDHEHLKLVDEFAKSYDFEERGKCATLAYYRFEDDLIDQTLRELLNSSPSVSRLRVLDLGCGTGRIEEFLCRNPRRSYSLDAVEIAAVDFSGKMLDKAMAKLEAIPECAVAMGRNLPQRGDAKLHVSLFRAPAENLEFLQHRYPAGFDFVIMGFGLLSYVKYGDVLPAVVAGGSNTGLVPLLRSGARVLFSVYNEQSAVYDRIRLLGNCDEERDLPIAALMNLSTGRLRVGTSREIACETFRCERIVRFLRQAGLSVDPGDVMTFPTAHLALSNRRVMSDENLSDKQKEPRMPGFQDDPILPPGRYSPSLLDLDTELSRALKDRGHYVLGLATLSSRRSGEEK